MGRARALIAAALALVVGLGANLLLDERDDPTPAGSGTGTPAAAEAQDDAATASPGARPGRPARALGDRTPAGGALLVLHGVVDPFEGDDPVITAPAGRRWIAADVEVTNLATDVLDLAGPRQFGLRDVTDRRFPPVTTAEDLPALDGPLAPGATRRGTLVFEVPEAAGDLRLAYTGAGEPVLIALD